MQAGKPQLPFMYVVTYTRFWQTVFMTGLCHSTDGCAGVSPAPVTEGHALLQRPRRSEICSWLSWTYLSMVSSEIAAGLRMGVCAWREGIAAMCVDNI